MTKFSLAENGTLAITSLIEQDGAALAYSEEGNLIVNEFIEVDNTSGLLVEIGGSHVKLHGTLIEEEEEGEPPAPVVITSLVDIDDRIIHGDTKFIVDNADRLEIETHYYGAGLVWEINLEPNQTYRWSADVEITISPRPDATIRAGIYNVSRGEYLAFDIFKSGPTPNVRQQLTGTFSTGSISSSHALELEIMDFSDPDGDFRFIIYKDSFKFVKED